ncbi:hypothetical protein OG435_33755 [Streptomyces sp. NBC_01264]|nr:hypothetical protein [Streptomyces sp. NBC_01264]MCX4781644.1 hypothetical protein [Streptomyces sp. NBC_01264]
MRAGPNDSRSHSAGSHPTSGPTATGYRAEMIIRFAIWDQIAGVTVMPTTA